MKEIKLLLALSILFFSQISYSQSCGNIATKEDINRLIKNRNLASKNSINKSNVTKYIPIRFHIVTQSDGTGGIPEKRIYDQLCSLNESYEPADMVFYAKDNEFNYVANSTLFNTPVSQSATSKIISEKNKAGDDCINIFITNKADTGGGGTTLGYYDPSLDIIVMKKAEINGFKGTLAHEMGHFFSLLHTFNGWEGEPYDADIHGNPIDSQLSPGGVLNELANGDNCQDSGDYICDTPGDYNFGFEWDGCSPYTGGARDFNGDLLNPAETNFMGYFIGCTEYVFTDDQIDIMIEDYESFDRNYIQSNHIPKQSNLQTPQIVKPLDLSTVDTYNNVELDWKVVEDAEGYLVEIKQGITSQFYNTEASEIILTNLQAGKKYRWNVTPYIETGGCASSTSEFEFTTGTITNTDNLESFEISIYPTILDYSNTISFSINQTSEVNTELYNTSGAKVFTQNKLYNSGVNSIGIPILLPGIYFFKVSIGNQSQTFKLIKQ